MFGWESISNSSAASAPDPENYPLIISAKAAVSPKADQPQFEAGASSNPGKNILAWIIHWQATIKGRALRSEANRLVP